MSDKPEAHIEKQPAIAPEKQPSFFPEIAEQTRRFHQAIEKFDPHLGPAFRFDDQKYDGCLVGDKGTIHEAGSRLGEVKGFEPQAGHHEKTGAKVIHVNGIINDVADQAKSCQTLANETGATVIGLHNGTGGYVCDLAQNLGDKAGIGKNKGVDSLRHAMVDAAKTGEPLNIVAHSHGALETSRAMRDAARELRRDGYSDKQIARSMHDNISVVSAGGAAMTYPEFANVRYLVNLKDQVPMQTGKGLALYLATAEQLNPFEKKEQKEAKIKEILDVSHGVTLIDENRGSQGDNHSFNDLYVKHMDPRWFETRKHRGLNEERKQ
jgi:hypothetical protein